MQYPENYAFLKLVYFLPLSYSIFLSYKIFSSYFPFWGNKRHKNEVVPLN